MNDSFSSYRSLGPLFVLSIILISFIVGCHRNPDPRLMAADALMESHPDSALMILSDFHFEEGSSPADSACYALLLTHARYKNFIDETDDSLISVAADRFLKDGDSERASRALFLKGMIQMNAGRLGEAAVSFRKGLDIAHEGRHQMWEGQCARGLFVLYGQLYDGSSQLEYAKKAYSAFVNMDDMEWSEYAKLNLARAYNNNGLFYEADSIVNEIIATCRNNDKTKFLDEAFQLKGLSLFALGRFEESLINYDKAIKLNPSILTPNDKHSIKIALTEIPSRNTLKGLSLPNDTAVIIEEDAFIVFARDGKYREAYRSLEQYKNEQDSILTLIINNNVAESISQYEEMKRILDEEVRKNNLLSFWMVLLLILVSGCILIWRYRERLHQERFLRIKIEADMECLRSDFKSQLENVMQASGKRGEVSESGTSEDFIRIIRQQYAETNQLCDDYYQWKKSEKERMSSQISHIVNDLTKNEGIEKIRKYVDEQTEGMYSSFTKDFFHLSDDDKRLFLYQMLGFSSRTIAVLIGYEPKTVYNRRARLKAKIENSDVPKRDMYLGIIQKTKKDKNPNF